MAPYSYAVMYQYLVDKNSGQYKAPFNQIKNEARVFTYKDTAIGRRPTLGKRTVSQKANSKQENQ